MSFIAATTRSRNLAPYARRFWRNAAANVVGIVDSLGVSVAGARYHDGALRGYDHPAGWRGFYQGAGGANGLTNSNASGLPGLTGITTTQRVVTDLTFGAGTYRHGLPLGYINDHHIATIGSFTPSSNNRIRRLDVVPANFTTGVVTDWFTDNSNLRAEIFYYYNSTPASGHVYAPDIGIREGAAGGTTTTELSTSEDCVGTLADPGLNLLDDVFDLTATTSTGYRAQLCSTSNWDADNTHFVHAGWRITNAAIAATSGIVRATIGEPSFSVDGHGTDSDPTDTLKQYTDDELDRFLSLVFHDRLDVPFYFEVLLGAESKTVAQWIASLETLLDRLRASVARVAPNSGPPHFLLLGTWRNDDDDSSQAQVEGYYEAAGGDVAMISFYGLDDGLFLDGTSPEQEAWAEANGWDALAINSGTIDLSAYDFGGSDATLTHPADQTIAMFRAYQVAQELQQAAAADVVGNVRRYYRYRRRR